MGTKNFLWSLNRLISLFSVLLIFSCQTVVRKVPPEPKPVPIAPMVEQQIVEEDARISVAGPEIIEQTEPPKVGIILGPGGMKTFAHLGVLQHLVRAKIPIDHIVGIGWASPIAALFASQGQMFDAEWKMLKLDPSILPRPGILTKSIKPGSVDVLDSFLRESFVGLDLSAAQIPFSCPIRSTFNSNVRFIEDGSAAEAIKPCLSALPYFKPHQRQYAALSAIREAADHMRKKGIEIVILVDVLREGDLIAKDSIENELLTQVMWSEIKGSIKSQSLGINEIISVHTQNLSLISSSSLRDFLRVGKIAGKSGAENLVEKYGF